MIVKGMSHRAMAVAVGGSKVQVTRDVRTILDDLTKTNHEAAERYQAVAIERLQQLVSVWWEAANGRESGGGAVWQAGGR